MKPEDKLILHSSFFTFERVLQRWGFFAVQPKKYEMISYIYETISLFFGGFTKRQ